MMIHGRLNNKMRFLFPGVNDAFEFLDCFVNDSANEPEFIVTISSELFNSSIY